MRLSEVPVKLIVEILKHLDTISLARSRKVCRAWRALHEQPQYKQLWRQACLRDIGRDCLIELTGDRRIFTDNDLGRSSAPSNQSQQENIDWKAIYQRWFRSCHIGKWPCMTTELKGHSCKIYSVLILCYPAYTSLSGHDAFGCNNRVVRLKRCKIGTGLSAQKWGGCSSEILKRTPKRYQNLY